MMEHYAYLVGWNEDLILKAGITSKRRWRTFVNRGATKYGLVGADLDSCLSIERDLYAQMYADLTPAFTDRRQAEGHLGSGGGGYMECFQARDLDHYVLARSMSQALLQAFLTKQCTDGRTDGQDGEPPHLRDHLPLSDACETDGEISSRLVVGA